MNFEFLRFLKKKNGNNMLKISLNPTFSALLLARNTASPQTKSDIPHGRTQCVPTVTCNLYPKLDSP